MNLGMLLRLAGDDAWTPFLRVIFQRYCLSQGRRAMNCPSGFANSSPSFIRTSNGTFSTTGLFVSLLTSVVRLREQVPPCAKRKVNHRALCPYHLAVAV